MKKVLFLAYYFPPMAVSGSMRPAGFCSHLKAFGYDVHVVSNEISEETLKTIPVDNSLLDFVPDHIRVSQIGHVDRMQQLQNIRSRLNRRPATSSDPEDFPGKDEAGQNNAENSRIREFAVGLVSRATLFPDRQRAWMAAVKRFARQLPREDYPDIVFATGNPWSALVAGGDIAARFEVPYVADFRDPWTENPKPPLPELAILAQRAEAAVIARASHVIANTEALRQSFARLYPQHAAKISTITNGYHENITRAFAQIDNAADCQPGVRLEYYGSVYELRKPTVLLQALEMLAENDGIRGDDLRVTFTGNWGVTDVPCNRLVEKLESLGIVQRNTPVSHADYLHKIKVAQHLLVLQQEFPLQIPAKIYEYIATGRPLFVVGGQGATGDLVREKSLGLACANETNALLSTLREMIARKLVLSRPPENIVGEFAYGKLTKRLAETFNELLGC